MIARPVTNTEIVSSIRAVDETMKGNYFEMDLVNKAVVDKYIPHGCHQRRNDIRRQMRHEEFTALGFLDALVVLELIEIAAKLSPPKWSEATFCHRVLGSADVVNRLRKGHVMLKNIQKYRETLKEYIISNI